jgi:hypothetical protein
LFYYVNQERIRRGIDPLVRHDGLDLIARNRSYDMGVRGYFGHYGTDGKAAIKAEISKADFNSCDGYGENIAATRYGPDSVEPHHPKTAEQIPREMTRGFMYSTPHRRAILDRDYETVGLGAFAERKRIYVTMVFCNSGEVRGSRYYDQQVDPAIRHPEWLPKHTRDFVRYDYDKDGSESVEPPAWLDEVETLTPIPNESEGSQSD